MTSRPGKKKMTIVDIAEASGVSVTTVSRILNNKPDVAEETRQRVLQLMEDRGFAPQSAWQQIRSGKSRSIVLHFPQVFNLLAHRIIIAAALECEQAGYSINILVNPLSDSDLLATFRSGQADGMILLEILTHDARIATLRRHDYPFVMIGRGSDNAGLSFVDVEIEHGIQLAMQHLIDFGHRVIGFVTVSPRVEDEGYGYGTWALHSYQQACVGHGLEPIWCAGGAEAGVHAMLDAHPNLTAIITPHENCVISVLQAVRARGLRIPEDLSVIGLLTESMGELATPPMTTIGFPSDELGREAARILLGRLDGSLAGPQQLLIRPELNVRGSTGPARDHV